MSSPDDLFFEVRLKNGWGETVAVVRRPLSRDAAFMGSRAAENTRNPAPFGGVSPFEDAVRVLKVREFRRMLLREAGAAAGDQLSDFLQDREGWHGLDRQDRVEKIVREDR